MEVKLRVRLVAGFDSGAAPKVIDYGHGGGGEVDERERREQERQERERDRQERDRAEKEKRNARKNINYFSQQYGSIY